MVQSNYRPYIKVKFNVSLETLFLYIRRKNGKSLIGKWKGRWKDVSVEGASNEWKDPDQLYGDGSMCSLVIRLNFKISIFTSKSSDKDTK